MSQRRKLIPLPDDRVRVIKIGKEAIFEYLYENIIGDENGCSTFRGRR